MRTDILIILGVFILLAGPQLLVGAQWSEPQLLDTTDIDDYDVAVDVNNRICMVQVKQGGIIQVLYLFYVSFRNSKYHLFLKCFNDGFWSFEQSLYNATSIDEVNVAPDRYDGVHVVFGGYGPQHLHVYNNLTCTTHSGESFFCVAIDTDRMNCRHVSFTVAIGNPYYAYYASFFEDEFDLDSAQLLGDNHQAIYRSDYYSDILTDPFWGVHIAWERSFTVNPSSSDVYYQSFSLTQDTSIKHWNMNRVDRVVNKVVDQHGNYHLFMKEYGNDSGSSHYHIIRRRETPAVRLDLSSQVIKSGDDFYLSATVLNPTDAQLSVNLLVCLDAYGEYFWYPTWGSIPEETPISVDPEDTNTMDILQFTMPEMTSESGPYYFYAGLFSPDSGNLVGDPSGIGFVLRQE